jgi:hypothetical protein
MSYPSRQTVLFDLSFRGVIINIEWYSILKHVVLKGVLRVSLQYLSMEDRSIDQ